MLQKLRTRHPIDLPAEGWSRRRLFLAVLGGIAVLAVLIPLLLSLASAGLSAVRGTTSVPLAVGVGVGLLVLVLLVAGARGKPGWDR